MEKKVSKGAIYNELETLFVKFKNCPTVDQKVHTLSRIYEKLFEGLKAQSQISYNCHLHIKDRIEKLEKRKI